ncbi:MAG: methylmalonyl-CoA mutase family protein [Acidimicrobiia bacterium]
MTDVVTNRSGLEIPIVAGDGEQPGEFPFTRGIFPTGYRGRLWTMRQYSGFGTAEETNERYRFLLDRGQTGLSVALDLPTQCGYDPDHELARSEIGKVGVSLFSVREMERVFADIDLGSISTSFTINGTAAMVYAMYVAAADRMGVPRERLRGTIQNDPLKEYAARGTWIWPVRPSMRLVADSILFSNDQTPRFNPISIAGAHMRDAGATAAEEMAFTLANGRAYVEELVRRGGDVDHFGRRLSFFFYVHMDLFEEVAKFRAGRRLWAKIMRDEMGATDPKAMQFRFGVVCGGSSLTAEQPINNVVRVTIENLAAVLGGAQSIFTAAYDEAFQIPTEAAAELALRTQQVVALESGVAGSVDPLGGSHLVEDLTDRMEAQIRGIIDELDAQGGIVSAIETGALQARIAHRALELKRSLDDGSFPRVGVNVHTVDEDPGVGETFRLDPELSARVLEKLERLRTERDEAAVRRSLDALRAAAEVDSENLMPHLVDCAHAEATVGEMADALRDVWGEFIEPVRF